MLYERNPQIGKFSANFHQFKPEDEGGMFFFGGGGGVYSHLLKIT